ncbi:CAP domain-containing protein [Anianabacter salinae]|uniref:CAP domain-containing protein n=1 Tax=Anianabacter salinae TaxID=2851023 RepID=UPI00225E63A7|nr:CAP domain-containing protein [Anianabacter salinae]MBV0913881.1 CAP domain-containing protein [Anianabacter salinae]
MKSILIAVFLLPAAALAEPAPEVAARINAERSARGLAPLAVSPEATQAAERHAQDMARGGFLGHDGSDGSDIGTRLTEAGLRWCMAAENVAQGHRSAEAVTQGWMDSDGHRRNILSDARLIGTARVGDYWVTTYAAPCR